mmetsp:Transcript_32646/g.55661  ORF Transcript_32646/g.55661 Transcript_32646/m.55661 type:complete len:305 (-) Transcript_32646:106-1020(-)
MNPRIAAYALGFRSISAFSGPPLLPSRQIFTPRHLIPLSTCNNLGRSLTQHNMSTSTDDDVVDIVANIGHVRQMMDDAIASCERESGSVRLVAVSKTKPLELLQAAYETGQRYFGENYAQELMTKSAEMPDDVAWHFIGPLQSNKAAKLVTVVGLDKLACIETISTIKLAAKLNRAVDSWNEESSGEAKKLGIYIQVNTSGEETKSGVTPGAEVCDLVKQISEECPSLSIDGLMTIGAPGDDSCFDTLAECRDEVAKVLGREPQELDLSMGMSGDFEVAIAKGATSVRVGSTIFGARDYSNLVK